MLVPHRFTASGQRICREENFAPNGCPKIRRRISKDCKGDIELCTEIVKERTCERKENDYNNVNDFDTSRGQIEQFCISSHRHCHICGSDSHRAKHCSGELLIFTPTA